MVPELEKPRITEIQLRMDCNGCVQKIRKALRGVDGVYDISIDFSQQKLTVIGRAELDKILQAIKKTRKIAIICSHIDPNAPPPEQPSEPQAPPPPPPPPEAEPTPPSPPNPEEPPQPPPPPPPQETQPAEVKPSDGAMVVNSVEPKVIEEVHMVHHYPYCYVNNTQNEVPRYVYHWPYSDTLVGYKCPAPKSQYWTEPYDEEYYRWRRGGDGGRIGTVFSEENPNNCSIM